jgi:hypothetical protein
VDVTAVEDGTVTFDQHSIFADGEALVSTAAMRFRGAEELEGAVTAAGFVVEQISGGWNREPVGSGDGELLVAACRPSEWSRRSPRPITSTGLLRSSSRGDGD